MRRFAVGLGAVGFVLSAASLVKGDSILFTDFDHEGSSPIDYVVTIDDDTDGVFTVLVEHAATTPNFGDITGVFFDLSDYLNAANADITEVIGDIESVAFDTNNLPGGSANLNPIPAFHVGVGYYGFNEDDLQTVKFTVSDLGGTLSLSDFTRFGVRAQTVGPTLGGSRPSSSKEVSGSAITPAETVPLPVAARGGLGLIGLLAVRRAWSNGAGR